MIDWKIISKKIKGKLSKEEEAHFIQWYNKRIEHTVFFKKAKEYYRNREMIGTVSDSQLESSWKVLYENTVAKTITKNAFFRSWMKYAASVIILIVSGFFVYNSFMNIDEQQETEAVIIHNMNIKPGADIAYLELADGKVIDLTEKSVDKIQEKDGSLIYKDLKTLNYTRSSDHQKITEVIYNKISVPRGGRYQLVLSDSTKVWLNSETILRYPVHFTGNFREVFLEGEAYFEVTKNEEVPFLVNSGNQVLKVLGTEFNISTLESEDQIQTTLIEGSVGLYESDATDKMVFMKPGQQAIYMEGQSGFEIQEVDPKIIASWRHGRFMFEKEELGKIMKKLARWYNFEIIYEVDEHKLKRFSMNTRQYEEFDQILRMIARASELKFEIRNNTVIVK